jgi:hypothetical protein
VELNCEHHLIGYADDVNILGVSVLNIKKNTEALVVASKKIGLEVNAEKTKYMVVSQDQNVGQNHSIKIDDKFCERWNSSNILEQP